MLWLGLIGCRGQRAEVSHQMGTFGSDLDFLRQHTEIVLLTDKAGAAQVAIAPAYQGRVMTSTTGGRGGASFGWIGRAAISSGARQPHINVFGGEDRLWLGPEGGQFALYFAKGDPFDLDHWQVPEPIDWGSWEVSRQSDTDAAFRRRMHLVNYSGTPLDVDVERSVRLLSESDIATTLGQTLGAAVKAVAFESANTVTNAGPAPWTRDTGLVSIWILGMFNPSPETTIAIPFQPGSEAERGPIVNDAYFGKVPGDRLVTRESVLFFRGDGQYRAKIGLPPPRARALAGSYDASGHVLTLVQYTRPAGAAEYVNSMWELQSEPFKGDVVNSYNDGPPAPGKPPLGPFYEFETSSPALDLAPQARFTHVHRTFHLAGPDAQLDAIARATLGASLAEIAGAFRPAAAR